MLFRNRVKLIFLAILTGGLLVLLSGTVNRALAQEPDADISVAYGWWQVVTRPEIRLHVSHNQLYSEWSENSEPDPAFKVDWKLSEGQFKRLGKNRYLFTVKRVFNHPQTRSLSNDCRFLEFQLYPSDLAAPPKRMELMIEYHEFHDDKKALSGSCGGLPAYWPDWVLRKKLAKQK
jgi:hypothetical protein